MAMVTSSLFTGLIDDAAVFPPGNAPLPVAVSEHRRHRQSRYAGCIGPLLVSAGSASELAEILTTDPDGSGPAVRVALIVRPGGDHDAIAHAADLLRRAGADVVGAEFGWSVDWRSTGLSLPLALELPRGELQDAAVADLEVAHRIGEPVVAKFRTGPTPTWAWPDEHELAAVLVECVRRGLPLKLTGGLHHAMRGTYAVAGVLEENHGLLNVLAAVDLAAEGAGVTVVADVLDDRNATALATVVRGWDERRVARVRRTLVAFGCCDVRDPLQELCDLDVLAPDLCPKDAP